MHSSKFKFFKDTLLPFFLKSSRLKVQSCSSCVHSRGWRKDLGSGSGALSLSTSHQGDLWPLVSLITRLLMVVSLGKNQSGAKDDGRWSLQPITDWLRASDWTIFYYFLQGDEKSSGSLPEASHQEVIWYHWWLKCFLDVSLGNHFQIGLKAAI